MKKKHSSRIQGLDIKKNKTKTKVTSNHSKKVIDRSSIIFRLEYRNRPILN